MLESAAFLPNPPTPPLTPSLTPSLTPRAIVAELDRYIIGQQAAKRAVAVALRNRWRRQQLLPPLRDEVMPKNILLIGPTGCGKTEIARRLAKLAQAPFLKVEATKFTEVGYVGRDVESIIRDLVEISIKQTQVRQRAQVVARAEEQAELRILNALVGESASPETKSRFRAQLRTGDLDEKEIEISLNDNAPANMPMFDVPGGQMGMLNMNEMLGKMMGGRTKQRKLSIKAARVALLAEEADKLLDTDLLQQEALRAVEENGIVFLDEIDKITARSGEGRGGVDISREGVQRDLLPLIEGTQVNTKYGPVKTDHILFIASGAFHLAKPSDLLPELQGRLPIRVELAALTAADFARILSETEHSLIAQYTALLATEGVQLTFTEDSIEALAQQAAIINQTVENIGARRLHTLLERLLEDISFEASDLAIGDARMIKVDAALVQERIAPLAKNADLSRFIL